MLPDSSYIEIKYVGAKQDQNEKRKIDVKQFLADLIFNPRSKAHEWSKITNQTPAVKTGYTGQHLASLITGVKGVGTGARGHDLRDGSEVKTCSRIDQLDQCKSCGARLLRYESHCSNCGATDIARKDDSKWLFSVRSNEDLKLLTEVIPRILLILFDYPEFNRGNFTIIQIQAFEIWNNQSRHARFAEIMNNYLEKIYKIHIERNPNKTPAPKNFWPYSYQFYLCNPVKIFDCITTLEENRFDIEIDRLISPDENRAPLEPIEMPSTILNDSEIITLLQNEKFVELTPSFLTPSDFELMTSDLNSRNKKKLSSKFREHLPYLNESQRVFLELRDTDKISTAREKYTRK